ncbi:MAG: pirin family protein [Methylotenera sp.]|nr:pirin family protein [Methylotenera sp.]
MNTRQTQPKIQVRKSEARGHANHGWLDSYHSFSFANYYDPAHMGFSVLRVINEDIVEGGQGFGMHSHRDMEIITYMLGGAIQHKDSMGNGSVIRAGDVQRMTAGTGVRHSEFNASNEEAAHLLQIWLLPEKNGIEPGYEEKHFDATSKANQWRLIASHDAREGSLLIHQDVDLFATVLDTGKALTYDTRPGRSLYFQIARGSAQINGTQLDKGGAIAMDDVTNVEIVSQTDAEIVLFDLPSSSLYGDQE